MTDADKRAQLVIDIERRTGIDEPMIERLVRTFYERARADAVLGPVFEAEVDDWEEHIGRICAFWSSVVLMSRQYHGRPMVKHAALAIDAVHFDRWLDLFEDTARELCPETAAEHFIDRARRIALSLELGIATSKGILLAKGERYVRETGAS